jgi:hypothetical protein
MRVKSPGEFGPCVVWNETNYKSGRASSNHEKAEPAREGTGVSRQRMSNKPGSRGGGQYKQVSGHGQ